MSKLLIEERLPMTPFPCWLRCYRMKIMGGSRKRTVALM